MPATYTMVGQADFAKAHTRRPRDPGAIEYGAVCIVFLDSCQPGKGRTTLGHAIPCFRGSDRALTVIVVVYTAASAFSGCDGIL